MTKPNHELLLRKHEDNRESDNNGYIIAKVELEYKVV